MVELKLSSQLLVLRRKKKLEMSKICKNTPNYNCQIFSKRKNQHISQKEREKPTFFIGEIGGMLEDMLTEAKCLRPKSIN